ncbi:Phosphate transporter [Rhodospirillum rubrum ATCC 11170]|uniref:Phosphate transporter n=2 Tax=Rhodospirillum rubrum TaxID=1085 RepID=Q2RSR1_RHORT|nr:Phosphate transporter [Rhodospirillum rubrum ATCC 11170]MBK5954441.1 inorganic phosphate transporter [Rhodospirillum rubrum]HAP99800.1 inorganic phosphate transporter [Rhodospirillum rubrum]HCF18140.1 inorganic phosphate transporter [Rhodospirillum rubrum]
MISPSGPKNMKKLHKELKRFSAIEAGLAITGRPAVGIGLAVVFLGVIWAFTAMTFGQTPSHTFLVLAAVVGGYMALNIGANDVANNMGPAVGSRAMTMAGALLIAAICEASGAILAGGDVVETISKGIIDPGAMSDNVKFVQVMIAALLASALWVNLATYLNAPVSTTHAIVGGVMGAGALAAGVGAVHWSTVGAIVASWVISPMMGGVIAAALLLFVKKMILFQDDKIAAARRWIPVLIGLMAGAFGMYLLTKGLARVYAPPSWLVGLAGVGSFLGVWALMRPIVRRQTVEMENRRKAVSGLFTHALIFSSALLSFAHGANDVANAVGPLAAIANALAGGGVEDQAVVLPLWILVVGAAGISAGLFLFGPKLIRTVGEKITKLDRARAFCVSLSAAVTVLAASGLGLPVSSTHIAVGAVFGVGFLREALANHQELSHLVHPPRLDAIDNPQRVEKLERRRLVRRQHITTIGAAWVVTVPLSAALSAGLYLLLTAFLE